MRLKTAVVIAIIGLVTAFVVLATEVVKLYRELSTPTPVDIVVTPTRPPVVALPPAISSPVPSISPSIQPTLSNILFYEDFEKGTTNNFVIKYGKWQVIGDGTANKVFEANNLGNLSVWPSAEFGPANFGDYTVQYRVRLVDYDISRETGSGMVFLTFRSDYKGSLYAFAFVPYWKLMHMAYQAPNSIWVSIQGQRGEGTNDFKKNVWYSVRVDVRGEKINAYLDGNLVVSVEDSTLKTGGLALNTGPNTIAQFDDILVLR